jgi:heme exporter protein D
MIWQSASEFWAMGGYGVYVWGSMGVSAALLALEVWLARMGRHQALDAVCEAMDSQALDAETPGSAVTTSVAASRSPNFSQGTAT